MAALQNMAYECPGMDKHSKNDVRACHFSDVFLEKNCFVIPMYQRRYCWTSKQFKQLWIDIEQSQTVGLGHEMGKICLAPYRRAVEAGYPEKTTLCIDGQQRLTTTLLILAALRDAAQNLQAKNMPNADKLVETMNDKLFWDVDAFKVWKAKQDELHSRGEPCGIAEGDVLPFVRVIPSFEDRATFFAIVTGCYHSPASAEATILRDAKQYFDENILRKSRMPGVAESELEEVRFIYDHVMNGLQFVKFQVEHDGFAQQLFLWMQERTLIGSIQLFNRAPGVSLSVSDLLRNFILANFLSAGFHTQEEVFKNYWLPLEKKFGKTVAEFDQFFVEFFDKNISLYKKQLESGERTVPLPENSLPPLLQRAVSLGQHTQEIFTILTYYDAVAYLNVEYFHEKTPEQVEESSTKLLHNLLHEPIHTEHPVHVLPSIHNVAADAIMPSPRAGEDEDEGAHGTSPTAAEDAQEITGRKRSINE